MNNSIIVAWFLAIRTMLKNKKTFAIICLVLTMSFISLTFFGSVINGVTQRFEEQIIGGSTGYILLEAQDDEKYISNADNLQQKLIKLPLTVAIAKRIKVSASLDTDEVSLSKTITGIYPDDESSVTYISQKMVEGKYLSENDMEDIVLGATLVQKYASKQSSGKLLNVEVGDNIDVHFNNGIHEKFRVKGIYKTGANFNDGEAFITNKKLLSIYPELKDQASEISIRLPQRGFEQEYKSQLISLISVRDKVSDWTQKTDKIEQFTGSLEMVNQVTYVMGLLTALATIYIIIYIDIIHKRKQIGILKAVGINRNSILLSFMIQAFTYGLLGVLFGTLSIFAMQQYFMIYPMKMSIGKINMVIDTTQLLMSSGLLVLASLIAGFIPSMKAARDNILDAIFGG